MSVVPNTPIPAGWYPDPAGSFQQRWWTGTEWTNDFAQYRPTLIHSAPRAQHAAPAVVEQASSAAFIAQQAAATVHSTGPLPVQTASTQTPLPQSASTQTLERAVDPLPSFRLPDADLPPQTSVAQPNAGNAALVAVAPTPLDYSVQPINPSFGNDQPMFNAVREVRRAIRYKPERRFTPAVWVLALLPVAFVGAAYAVAAYLPLFYTVFVVGTLAVVFLMLGLLLAISDSQSLRRSGHDTTGSPAYALLTPVLYLMPRTYYVSRETGRNAVAPLILALLGVAAVVAALVLVRGLLPLLTSFAAL